KQEMKFIVEGIVRKRYGLIQLVGMVCIAIFMLVAWEFTTANFIWFIIGLLIVWIAIFEPLRRRDMKKELRKLYEIHGDIVSGELGESAYACNGGENIAINMLNVADKVEED
ncbi:unnamed protein product, partial [marine sediment metagenome]